MFASLVRGLLRSGPAAHVAFVAVVAGAASACAPPRAQRFVPFGTRRPADAFVPALPAPLAAELDDCLDAAGFPLAAEREDEPGCIAIVVDDDFDDRLVVEVRAALDGETVLVSPAAGSDRPRVLAVAAGTLPAGDHVLDLELRLRPAPFGAYAYSPSAYTLRSRHAFMLAPRGGLELVVRGSDTGGVTVPVENRLRVTFHPIDTARRRFLDAPPPRPRGVVDDGVAPAIYRALSLRAARRAVGLAEADLEEGRRERDIIRVTCVNDKLVALRAAKAALEAAGADEPLRLSALARRVQALHHEREYCLGETDVQVGAERR